MALVFHLRLKMIRMGNNYRIILILKVVYRHCQKKNTENADNGFLSTSEEWQVPAQEMRKLVEIFRVDERFVEG